MSRAAITFVLLFGLCVTPSVARAQGSGAVGGDPSGLSAIPFVVTRSVNGIVAEIEPKLRLIAIVDEKGRRHEFRVVADTRFFADKNTELAGKKELDLIDFQPGWPVRFTFRPDDKYKRLADLKLRRVKR